MIINGRPTQTEAGWLPFHRLSLVFLLAVLHMFIYVLVDRPASRTEGASPWNQYILEFGLAWDMSICTGIDWHSTETKIRAAILELWTLLHDSLTMGKPASTMKFFNIS